MDGEESTFDQYFIVGQESWLTKHVKSIILKKQNYICPVFKSLSFLCNSHMSNTNARILVFVDISVVTVEDLLKLISAHQLKSDRYLNISIVFFNVSKNALAFPFLCIPGIRGFLKREIDDALLVEGIVTTIRGALWFPKDLLNEVTRRVLIDTDKRANDSIQLTGAEQEVLRYMSVGASENDIAENSHVDPSTVTKRISDIYNKLKFKNYTTAVRIAGGLACSSPPCQTVKLVSTPTA